MKLDLPQRAYVRKVPVTGGGMIGRSGRSERDPAGGFDGSCGQSRNRRDSVQAGRGAGRTLFGHGACQGTRRDVGSFVCDDRLQRRSRLRETMFDICIRNQTDRPCGGRKGQTKTDCETEDRDEARD